MISKYRLSRYPPLSHLKKILRYRAGACRCGRVSTCKNVSHILSLFRTLPKFRQRRNSYKPKWQNIHLEFCISKIACSLSLEDILTSVLPPNLVSKLMFHLSSRQINASNLMFHLALFPPNVKCSFTDLHVAVTNFYSPLISTWQINCLSTCRSWAWRHKYHHSSHSKF